MLLRTEATLLRREPATALLGVLAPILILFAVALLPDALEVSDDLGGIRVIDTFVPTLGVFAVATLGLMVMPSQLTRYRERGVLKRLRATPATPLGVIGAQLTLNAGVGVVAIVAVTVVGRLAFDVPLPDPLLGWVVAIVLTATAILSIGLVVAALAPSAKLVDGIGPALWFPLMFLGGLWLPRPAMGETLRTVSDLSPVGAAVGALQDVTTGATFPDGGHLLVLLAWTVLGTALAVRTFRWQ